MNRPAVVLATLSLGVGCSAIFGNDLDDYRHDRCLDSAAACNEVAAPNGGTGGSGGSSPSNGGSSGNPSAGTAGAAASGVGGVGAGGVGGTETGGTSGATPVGGSGNETGGVGGMAGDGSGGVGASAAGGMGGVPAGGSGGESATGGGGGTGGSAVAPPSCIELPSICGPNEDDDCCASDVVFEGTFIMGNDASPDAADKPAHQVTLGSFRLDRYEVTLGRFRKFLEAYDEWPKPLENEGSYRSRPSTGWLPAWNGMMPVDAEALRESVSCTFPTASTWTDIPDAENVPISCVQWHVAYAFCIWDGGRLPTEAEWEYAAVGGTEQRNFPWGTEFNPSYLNNGTNKALRVGGAGSGAGRGRFGQYDLMGNVWEWVRDRHDTEFYSESMDAVEPLNPFVAAAPVVRGVSFYGSSADLLFPYRRVWAIPDESNATIGVRCARD